MKVFKLDSCSSWKFLPWNQINERIFILKKQIYQASKACKYCSLYRIQNTLVNSNEAKVLAIEEIFTSLFANSLYYDQDHYQINDKDKFFIFHNLFQEQRTNEVSMILIEKIKQYLLYLCIQPEWEARFEPTLQSNIVGQTAYLLQERLISFLDYRLSIEKNWHYISLDCQTLNKYINPKYIIQKIQSGAYIHYCLNFWLDNNYIQEFTQDLILGLKFNILHQFLYRIVCNGIEWFYSLEIELQLKSQPYNNVVIYYETSYWLCIKRTFIGNLIFILKFLYLGIPKYKNCSFCVFYSQVFNITSDKTKYKYISMLLVPKMQLVNNTHKLIFKLIKYSLYKRDLVNRLRVNTNINIIKTLTSINRFILQFYDYYCLFLPLKIIKKIYQQVDFMIYSWVRKSNKHSHKLTIRRYRKNLIRNLFRSKQNVLHKICIEKIIRE